MATERKKLKTTNNERNNIINNLQKLKEEENVLLNQLKKLDYEKKYKEAKKFVGSYFQEISKNKTFIICTHVYGVRESDCSLLSIKIYYFSDEPTYFGIENCSYFKQKDENGKIAHRKISKDSFDKHYKIVQNRIDLHLKNK